MAAGASSAQYNKYGPYSQTAATVHLAINNNSTWRDAFQFTRPDDPTWNLVGCTFEMDVQRNSYDLVPLLSMSATNGQIVIADPIQRVIYFNVSPDDIQASLKPGTYVYDLVIIEPTDVRTLLMTGTVTVQQGVTYPPTP
jgi:hypothetical protein